MEYIVAGIIAVICIAVIIWGLKVLKENRKLAPPKKKDDNEDDILNRP